MKCQHIVVFGNVCSRRKGIVCGNKIENDAGHVDIVTRWRKKMRYAGVMNMLLPAFTTKTALAVLGAVEEKLVGQQFTTIADEEAIDENERLLRHVLVRRSDDPREDARLLGEELLREGTAFARLDTRTSMYDKRYSAAELDANVAGRGIWSACPNEAQARIASDARLRRESRESEANTTHKKGCDIKGNIASSKMGKVYFLPRCPNYYKLIVDESRGEKYFCTEAEAKKAGFRKSDGCGNAF